VPRLPLNPDELPQELPFQGRTSIRLKHNPKLLTIIHNRSKLPQILSFLTGGYHSQTKLTGGHGQNRIRNCVKNNEEYFSRELRSELEEVEYPVHFLDFETLGLAVPRYAGTRPYQTVPFQWSDHILYGDGKIEHREYLCDDDKDPREEFAVTLLEALEGRGSVITYTSYEEGVIRGLAEDLPRYRDQLLAILGRIIDLYVIIKKHYYHPEFHGSFSLKSVLPALLPEMDYRNLDVQEGQQAGLEYLRMISNSTSSNDKKKIRKALLNYCEHDTLAMLKIREELLKGV